MSNEPKRERGKPKRDPYKSKLFSLSKKSLWALDKLEKMGQGKQSNIVEGLIIKEAGRVGVNLNEYVEMSDNEKLPSAK